MNSLSYFFRPDGLLTKEQKYRVVRENEKADEKVKGLVPSRPERDVYDDNDLEEPIWHKASRPGFALPR